jgi:hypothetical protein
VSDENKPEQSDDDAISAKVDRTGGTFRIPFNNPYVGPYVKYLILSISALVLLFGIGLLLALSK